MGKFAIVEWESNKTSDYICKELLKKTKSNDFSGNQKKQLKKRKQKRKHKTNINKNSLVASRALKITSGATKTIDTCQSIIICSKKRRNIDISDSKKLKKRQKSETRADKHFNAPVSDDSKLKQKVNTNEINTNKKKYKQKLQNSLQQVKLPNSHSSNTKKSNLTLREKMMEKLKAARFRYINEQIYTNRGKDMQNFFKNDSEAFKAYHSGYRQQVERWPLNPVDIIIKRIHKLPLKYVIADFGCGEAKLAQSVKQTVHSFDLLAENEFVTACDMAQVPLEDNTVDVVVFCLSLMGTNLQDYLLEANRVLRMGGLLKIAEVESRFDAVETFIKNLHGYGFSNITKDLSHNLFYFLDFKKISDMKKKKKKPLPVVSLHPCLYKKR